MAWLAARDANAPKPPTYDLAFKTGVQTNIDMIVKRAETMACKLERDQVLYGIHSYRSSLRPWLSFQAMQQSSTNSMTIPVCHTVVNLISAATNPFNLIKMTEPYHPWF
jgi:transformation/transcription domain-associated protein